MAASMQELELLAAGWRVVRPQVYRHVDERELFRDDRAGRWHVRRRDGSVKDVGRTLRDAIKTLLPAEGPLLAGLEARR